MQQSLLTAEQSKREKIGNENNSSHRGRLFDRFYTVETGQNSTDLGLSIAKTLVDQMGGKMQATYQDKKLTISLKLNNL